MQPIAEPLLADSVLHFFAQGTVADEERVERGNTLHGRSHGANEVQRIFMPDELRYLHNEGRAARHPEGKERLRRRWPHLAMHVRAIRHDGDTRAVDSVGDEDVGNGTRDGDDRVGTAILPSRAGVAPEMKVHATGDDERGTHA